MNYKKMYFKLAGQLANAVDSLSRLSETLKEVQIELERDFMEMEE